MDGQDLEGLGSTLNLEADREKMKAERRAVEDQILYPDERDSPANETVEVCMCVLFMNTI
jgi:hypothetical protein